MSLIVDIFDGKKETNGHLQIYFILFFLTVGFDCLLLLKLFVNIPHHLRIQKVNKCPCKYELRII